MRHPHLLTVLLWTSRDDSGEFLDSRDCEPSPALEEQLDSEFAEFLASLPPNFDPAEHYIGSGTLDTMLEYDYILTRNHHGAGFWDGDWGVKMGELLTRLAHHKPEIEPYVGDDGLIYA